MFRHQGELYPRRTRLELDLLTSTRNAPPTEDPVSHENEGFLKSVWHKMTHHPAHEKTSDGETTTASSKESSKEPSTKKGDDEAAPKKNSDSA